MTHIHYLTPEDSLIGSDIRMKITGLPKQLVIKTNLVNDPKHFHTKCGK